MTKVQNSIKKTDGKVNGMRTNIGQLFREIKYAKQMHTKTLVNG